MENFLLFVVTVLSYTAVWWWMRRPQGWNKGLKHAGIIALLCVPWNINGHILTIIGNAKSEKSICSLASLYQKAGTNAYAAFFVGYQEAGQMASTAIGLAGYQKAGQDAVVLIGLAGYQEAQKQAWVTIGLALYQKIPDQSRSFGAFTPLRKLE